MPSMRFVAAKPSFEPSFQILHDAMSSIPYLDPDLTRESAQAPFAIVPTFVEPAAGVSSCSMPCFAISWVKLQSAWDWVAPAHPLEEKRSCAALPLANTVQAAKGPLLEASSGEEGDHGGVPQRLCDQ